MFFKNRTHLITRYGLILALLGGLRGTVPVPFTYTYGLFSHAAAVDEATPSANSSTAPTWETSTTTPSPTSAFLFTPSTSTSTPSGTPTSITPNIPGNLIYVKWNATGASTGASWIDAYVDLQTALADASRGDEIWVAAGTYIPTTETSQTATFQLESGVAIYGGFVGTEGSRDQRNPIVNVTILSGDIGQEGTRSDNSYHVVTGSGTDGTAVLDGFTITDGNADSTNGGGMLNSSGSPTLTNLIFYGNNAANGGGMYNSYSNPSLTKVTFLGNESSNWGGGMFNVNSSPLLMSVAFISNGAVSSGGGMMNYASSPTLVDSLFKGNHVATLGGGMFNFSASSPKLTNVTFSGNSTANSGGGIYNQDSHPTLTNVTLSGNISTMYGGGIANLNSNPSIRNTILWRNSAPTGSQIYNANSIPTIRYSVLQESGGSGSFWNTRLGIDGGHNLDAEPLLGPLQDNGGFTQTMALGAGSPAIDAGNNANCLLTDQRGAGRQGTSCDIGAYEAQLTSLIHHVKSNANGANNGTSWANAYTDLQSALSVAASGDEIWVAAGTYKPTTGVDRTISFVLKNGVVIYGGFAGTETEREQRDVQKNLTVLSGDIGVSGNTSDNSYHVVVGSNTNTSAVLDGFTITAGNANGDSYPSDQSTGGGMYNIKGNPIIMNVIFRGNAATFGAGVYNGGSCPTCSAPGSSPILRNVIFDANVATMDGGGMRNETHSQPVLTDVIFGNNTAARRGGGMQIIYDSNPILTNVTFANNTASAGGGIEIRDYSVPTLTNVTFHANSATASGGALDIRTGSWPVLNNVTISDNQAEQGGGIYNNSPRTEINNSILYSNSADQIYNAGGTVNVSYSIVQGGYPGTANMDVNPLLGPLQDNGSFTQTRALVAGSPAIDAGKIDAGYNGNCSPMDQRGIPRPQGYRCDIGAFEYIFSGTPTAISPTWQPSTPTPTFTTKTPTRTPTKTSTAITTCNEVSHSPLIIDGSTSMSMSITNHTGNPLAIQDIFLVWDHDYGHSAGNDKTLNLREVSLNEIPVWTGDVQGPSYTISPASTSIPTGNSILRFTFHQTYDRSDGSEELYITLATNGCQTYPIHYGSGAVTPTSTPTWFPYTSTPTPTRYVWTPSTSTLTPSRTPTPTASHTITPTPAKVGIDVRIGAVARGIYSVQHVQSLRVGYAGINNGPVQIMSTMNNVIVGSESSIYSFKGTPVSFSEMMGLPDRQLDTIYWLPWYNNVDLDTQLRIGNVSNTTAHVNIFVAGMLKTQTPIILAPGASIRQSFAGVNNGPVKIESDVNIVAAERVIYKVNGANTSFTEMMALPNHQLDDVYWLPWYNNVDLDTQLRIANISSSSATVYVYAGGQQVVGSPFTLAAGASTRKSFTGVNTGPIKIVSDQNIVAAERVIYKAAGGINTSFSEMMALPNKQVDTTYWLPWYNNQDMDTQLRFANLSNSTATVRVFIAGKEIAGSPFTLTASSPGKRVSFAGINNGPVKIVSNQKIVVAERVIYKFNGTPTSFSEILGLPGRSLDILYWFPWYNNVDLKTELWFGAP